jgi:hypothetical protein
MTVAEAVPAPTIAIRAAAATAASPSIFKYFIRISFVRAGARVVYARLPIGKERYGSRTFECLSLQETRFEREPE